MLIRVDGDEFNTILAALRTYQEAGYGDPAERPDRIQDIACPTDDDTSLDDTAIDDLCERINCEDVDIEAVVREAVVAAMREAMGAD